MDRRSSGECCGDYPVSHPNLHPVASFWPSDNPISRINGEIDPRGGGSPSNGRHYQDYQPQHDRDHHNFSPGPNDSVGRGGDFFPPCSSSLSGRKRSYSHSGQGLPQDYTEGGSFVKLYVRGVPRTVTEQDILAFFGKYGTIVEVVLLKDRRTGQQQETCFVKYSRIEDGDRAIGELHNQHAFPGGAVPLQVKYASGEQERLGFGSQECKLYVACLDKRASKVDIAEIFSPYGCVQEVFLLRDELKQNRGLAFVQLPQREMAIAAINALHGKYVMEGCDQPLTVRFADPRKPKAGEPSRPAPNFSDSIRQPLPPTASHMSSQCEKEPSISPGLPVSARMEDPPGCDWSEHICPDGYEYYYNCVTCESRWEKPWEYCLYEQELEKLEVEAPTFVPAS